MSIAVEEWVEGAEEVVESEAGGFAELEPFTVLEDSPLDDDTKAEVINRIPSEKIIAAKPNIVKLYLLENMEYRTIITPIMVPTKIATVISPLIADSNPGPELVTSETSEILIFQILSW